MNEKVPRACGWQTFKLDALFLSCWCWIAKFVVEMKAPSILCRFLNFFTFCEWIDLFSQRASPTLILRFHFYICTNLKKVFIWDLTKQTFPAKTFSFPTPSALHYKTLILTGNSPQRGSNETHKQLEIYLLMKSSKQKLEMLCVGVTDI